MATTAKKIKATPTTKTVNTSVNVKEIANSYFDVNQQFVPFGKSDIDLIETIKINDKLGLTEATEGQLAFNKWCDKHSLNCLALMSLEVSTVNPKSNKHSSVKPMSHAQKKECVISTLGQTAYDLCPSDYRSRALNVARLIESGDVSKILKDTDYSYNEKDYSFYNSMGAYISYASLAKKLTLTTDKATGEVSKNTSKAKTSGNAKGSPKKTEKPLDQFQLDTNLEKQIEVYVTNTEKVCKDKEGAVYSALITFASTLEKRYGVDQNALLEMLKS